ncbi:hypothetical protein EON80_16150, partial [bacterium]
MSLFSRLDRVREKAQTEAEAEDGMFAVPDLGPRDAQGAASATPPAPPAEETSLPSSTPEAPAPYAAVPDAPVPDAAVPVESAPEVPAPIAPVSEVEPASAPFETSPAPEQLSYQPTETPSYQAAPAGAADETARTPFDRLMAESAEEAEAAEAEAAAEAAAAQVEPERRFSDFSASSAPVQTAPSPAPFEPEDRSPDFSTPPPPVSAPTPAPAAPSYSQPTFDPTSGERSSMDNPTPGYSQPNPPEGTPLRPTADRPFSDRFAGRAGLDRDVEAGNPLVTTTESAPEPVNEATRAPLARVESDVAQSEREAKNRGLYRRKHLIFDSVLSSIDPRLLQAPTRDGLRGAIEKGVDGSLREFNLSLENSERSWLIEEFLRETTDFGPLVSLLDDPGINKILVSGSSDVTIEKLGRMERTGVSFRDDDHLLSVIRRLAETVGGRIDAKVPLLDRPLPDGARVRAKIPPMAPQPTLTIEKSSGNPFVVLKRQQAERGRGDNLPYAQL